MEALKALDQNEKLFVKILYDFKKRYSSFPATLRKLSVISQWQEIAEIAHTIKGVSGYIGSSFLMKSAQKLEDTLRNNQQEDAAGYLVAFINTLDEILSSLSLLPPLPEENPGQTNQNQAKFTSSKEIDELIRVLIGQLKKGEVAAEEQFAEIEKQLAGTGFEELLKRIADLIDEIEYERAANMTESLLMRIQQQREN